MLKVYIGTKQEATSETPLCAILLSMPTQPDVAQAAKTRQGPPELPAGDNADWGPWAVV